MAYPSDSFVHLHGHSHYSLLDGGATIEGLCKKCKEYNMPALALTDHGSLFGAIEFYNEGKKAGIKPILGCEFYVAPGSLTEKDSRSISDAAYHLVVLAKNAQGWKNMLKLASIAYVDGFYYRPRVDKAALAKYSEGLIVINGHFGTEISHYLEQNDLETAVAVAKQYKDIFGADFYVELQHHNDPAQVAMLPKLVTVAQRVGSPLVATNDHHYLLKEDHEAHDALCCISMGRTVDDPDRLRYSTELYLKSPKEMREVFKDYPEACDNTLKIAEECDVTLDFSQRHAPVYEPPITIEGKRPTPDEYLRDLCMEGAREKYGEITPAVQERMDYELKTIQSKGFSSYFLIVWDFCNFAKRNGIPVGARGSGVGAMVSYVLSLCNVDPLRYDLLFERFMDPSRKEMPDIDIDICQEGRQKIIEYVRQKYGNVCQIITFNTLGAKAAIKDVGRVLGLPIQDANNITKLVPAGVGVTLADTEKVSDVKRLIDGDAKVAKVFKIAKRLEGLCRNAGMHAAGVIVCNKPLDEIVPLYKTGDDVMTQWDGPTCEKMGLLKMDFLGLRTLTIIERAKHLIAAGLAKGQLRPPAGVNVPRLKDDPTRLDLDQIDLTDQHVFQTVFQKGMTRGVFQFESGGMKDLLIKMKPDRIEDLIAANALYRPGPMQLIPDYCDRKHKRKAVPQIHPIMDRVLSETYGVMVYQEQVMRIFNQLGKIELANAYKLIKAISKKDTKVIASNKEAFIKGAGENGVTKEKAVELFGLIEEFGKYGFNKSHSTRYSLIAFQTAWLKTYFPVEYMAALLTFEMIDQTKVSEYLDECRYLKLPSGKVGIDILPPDINSSDSDFTVVGETIRFGLGAVKGVGEKAIQAIVNARHDKAGQIQSYKSIMDFCERVDLRVVNKSVTEALVKCGAFDGLHNNRAALLAGTEQAIRSGQQAQESLRLGQESLFGGPSTPTMVTEEYRLPAIPEWPMSEKMALEKQMLGFYVSNHPLRDVEDFIASYCGMDTRNIKQANDKADGVMGGIVAKISQRVAKKGPSTGKKWAIVTIEDLVGSLEVMLFSNQWEKFAPMLKQDSIVILRGKVDRSREEPSFQVSEVLSMAEARLKMTREVVVETTAVKLDQATIAKLVEVIKGHQGSTAVKLELNDLPLPTPSRVQVQMAKGISIGNGALPALYELFGEKNVLTVGPTLRRRKPTVVLAGPELDTSEFDPSDEI